MSEPTFPYGYAGDPQGMATMLTRAQCEDKETVYKLHPEFWRRMIALMEHGYRQGVPLGVGTGWRVQPDPPPPGFAPAGNSNHEGFPADGAHGGAVAIDTVPDVSWGWMEANLAPYGLRSFRNVNDEPWHVQPAEIPASRNWRSEPWTLARWPLPEEDPMPLSDDDLERIAAAVWAKLLDGKAASWRLRQTHGIARYYLGGWDEDWPDPTPPLLQQIDKNTS